MPKCGCAGSTCACKVEGTSPITVTGTGTTQDPYLVGIGDISVADTITVDDGTSITMSLLGSGTLADPYVISASLDPGATDVSTPTTGGTTTIDSTTLNHVLDFSTTIATHTITLPASSTALAHTVTIFSDGTITALTVNGAGSTTVVGAPTTLDTGCSFTMRLVGTTWRSVGVAWAN